jgi:hypothetical protein
MSEAESVLSWHIPFCFDVFQLFLLVGEDKEENNFFFGRVTQRVVADVCLTGKQKCQLNKYFEDMYLGVELAGNFEPFRRLQIIFIRHNDKSMVMICNSNDYQHAAKSILSQPLYEYIASGTDDEQTLSENVSVCVCVCVCASGSSMRSTRS